jgi:nucleoside-diphosphate-sugar epimerase
MDVLVIGGNRFMGRSLVWRLLFAGHRVTVLNRGSVPDPFDGRVELVIADRTTETFDRALAGRAFDRVIDLAGFSGDDVARTCRVLGPRLGHYLFVSTGQVYLVRTDAPRPASEDAYAGPVMPAPPTDDDREDWEYGVGKRAAEDALAASGLPHTRVRIPMVNGERDPKRRLERYLWRMLDGGPLLVPGADAIARHVYRGAVVEALAAMVERPPPGVAYNLAQREQPTVRELLERLGALVGVRPRIVDVPAAALAAAGIPPTLVSPLSTTWMSHVDPSRAERELGFAHPPLDAYLAAIVGELMTGWPAAPPPGLEHRSAELAWS